MSEQDIVSIVAFVIKVTANVISIRIAISMAKEFVAANKKDLDNRDR